MNFFGSHCPWVRALHTHIYGLVDTHPNPYTRPTLVISLGFFSTNLWPLSSNFEESYPSLSHLVFNIFKYNVTIYIFIIIILKKILPSMIRVYLLAFLLPLPPMELTFISFLRKFCHYSQDFVLKSQSSSKLSDIPYLLTTHVWH